MPPKFACRIESQVGPVTFMSIWAYMLSIYGDNVNIVNLTLSSWIQVEFEEISWKLLNSKNFDVNVKRSIIVPEMSHLRKFLAAFSN